MGSFFKVLKITVLFFVAFIIFSCGGNKENHSVTINGKFVFSRGETVYLYDIKVYDKVAIDSVRLKESGEFSFSFEVDDAMILWLGTAEDNYVTLVCEGGEILEISADVRNIPGTYTVSGSSGSEQIQELHFYTIAHYAKFDTLSQIWENRKYDNDKLILRDSLDSVALGIYTAQEKFVMDFVETNNESLAAIMGLYQVFGRVTVLDEFEHIQLFRETAMSLKEKYPANEHVNELMARVEKNTILMKEKEEIIKRLQPGNPVPELSLPGKDGAPVSVSDYKGYTILIYFWSATCPKSRKMNAELVNVSKLHSPRGFLLFSVSLDNNPEVWKKAIELDKLPGIHVNDQRDWHSPVVKVFNIPELPYSVLVDKDGNIVANGLSSEEINIKLYEILPFRKIQTDVE